MTGTQAITEIRYAIDEPTAAAWTDAELLVYFNHAQEWAVDLIERINGDYFVTSTNLSTTADTASIALPADFRKVKRLEWINGNTSHKSPPQIWPIKWQDKTGAGWYWWNIVGSASGTPMYYYFQGSNLMLDPVPGSSVTNAIRLWYCKRLADVAAGTSSEIPAEWHRLLVQKAAVQALQKTDPFNRAATIEKEIAANVPLMLSALGRRQIHESSTMRDVWGG